MGTLKSATLIFAVVFVAVFIVPRVPAFARALTTSAMPVAVQAGSGQVIEFASARVLRAEWDRGDRDHRYYRGDRDDWGDWDDRGGGIYFGGAPYYGYQPYYYNPYYYQRPSYGFWFNF